MRIARVEQSQAAFGITNMSHWLPTGKGQITMKIGTGLALFATVIAIILVAQWSVSAQQTKVKGIPKAPGAPVTFKANEGDLAVYEGPGSATEESESGPQSARYDFKRTQFILGASYSDSTTAAVLTEVTFSKETRHNDTFLAPVATGVAIDRMPMTRPTSAGEQPRPALPDLPQWGFPDRPSVKLGDEWTTEEPTPNNTYLLIPLKCKVAAREEVGGRMCLRVDVEPTETVPFKLTKTAVLDGMQPAPAMLTEVQETIWIGESDGWFVKRTHAIKLEPTEVSSSGKKPHPLLPMRLLPGGTEQCP